jgi:hypothetical protein
MIMRRKLTPSQRLWTEVFGLYGLPKLDGTRVLAIADRLLSGEARAMRLSFGFEGDPLSYEELSKKLLRCDGRQGVARETTRLEVKRAIRHLRRPSWRKDWDGARK